MSNLNLIATSTFGLEATLKRELNKLGFNIIKTTDGKINFIGNLSSIPKCNICLRSADRVFINLGEFNVYNFEELFEKTKSLPWEDWLTKDGKFIVNGKSIKSKLFSISDCQSIIKKAIIERLKLKYKINWFEETGPEYKIQFSILNNIAVLKIDTTGAGLHKRGYRKQFFKAPIKETLAYALIELSYWKKDRILLDPTCGSGTIPIEAAMIAKNIPPGLNRKFISEEWPQIPKTLWKEERNKAYCSINTDFYPKIYGYDIDAKAIEIAKQNAKLAGVDDCIHFEQKPFNELSVEDNYGILICNPPYGERIGNDNDIKTLYKDIGKLFKQNKTWSVYVITSNESFEKFYGKKADKKRKLFNGMIKTNYYQFIGPKPKLINMQNY